MEKMKSFQEDIMLSDRSELDEKYFHKSHKGKIVGCRAQEERDSGKEEGDKRHSSAPLPAYLGMERPLPRYTTWESLRRLTWRT